MRKIHASPIHIETCKRHRTENVMADQAWSGVREVSGNDSEKDLPPPPTERTDREGRRRRGKRD